MKTEDTMDTKKKVYNMPELVEHGGLDEVTQDGCEPGIGDIIDYYNLMSNSCV